MFNTLDFDNLVDNATNSELEEMGLPLDNDWQGWVESGGPEAFMLAPEMAIADDAAGWAAWLEDTYTEEPLF